MTKVALNREYGAFRIPMGVAHEVALATPELESVNETKQFGAPACETCSRDLRVRAHPAVIAWVERDQPEDIELVEIPDSVSLANCVIFDYDGIETVVQRGSFWPETDWTWE